MITKETAKLLAEKQLAEYQKWAKEELVIHEEETIETNLCWIFFWQSKKFLKFNSKDDELIGCAPFIIDKINGNIYKTGTAEDVNVYLKRFKKLYKKYSKKPEILQKKILGYNY